LAVYTGIEALEAAEFVPLTHFCAAYHQVGQLPDLTGKREYLGHIHDLDLYFSAGCFVQHLIQTYGIQDFKRLFTSGDYPGIYGHTLAQLETEWIRTLDSIGDELTLDPNALVDAVEEIAAAYDRLFSDFSGTPSQLEAYRILDQARIAMLQGEFEKMKELLPATRP
jgi:hypothetical protein